MKKTSLVATHQPYLLLLLACFTCILFCLPALAQEQQTVNLGKFVLESGKAIEACQLGYRTFGKLNADKSNAVLCPVWIMGTSASHSFLVGTDKMLDSSRYFIIIADAFGNGVSASPSNSTSQPGQHFPQFTIRDMVRAQHRLVTDFFKIKQLHAVVGISMGAFQVFEWAVTYPDMVKKAVPIVGSPQLTSYDLMVFETMFGSVADSQQCPTCDPVDTFAPLFIFLLRTPLQRIKTIPRTEYPGFIHAVKEEVRKGFQPEDVKSQIRAILAQDVSQPFKGSLAEAARKIKAEVLVIVNSTDQLVNPRPAVSFAGLINARVVDLNSECGHEVEICEQERVYQEVSAFLSASPAR